MSKVAVFGEVYSSNVGDGIIFDSLEYLFGLKGVQLIPCDLSGRQGWLIDDREQAPKPVDMFRKMMGMTLKSSKLLRRMYSAAHWFAFGRREVSARWENVIASSDAVLIGGGQLLTDINFGFPLKIFEVARIAKAHQKPLVFFGCGVGSNGWGYIAKKMYGYSLGYASYVSCRDYLSSEVIKRYYPEMNIHVHPDPAFVFGEISYPRTGGDAIEPPVIGFNFQSSAHFRQFVPELKQLSEGDYESFWVSVIRAAESEGYCPVIFSNGDPLDYRVSESVFGRLVNLGARVKLLRRPTRPSDLYGDICSMDCVVTTRMHAGIAAHALRRPIATFAWDKKVESVWAAVGKPEVVVSSSIFYSNNPWDVIKNSLFFQPSSESDAINAPERLKRSVDVCLNELGI